MPPSRARARARPAAAAEAPDRSAGWWAAAGLAALGIGVSGYLWLSAARGLAPVCLVGACDKVASSAYARFLGMPVAAWGFAAFLAVGVVAASGARRLVPRERLLVALFGLTAFGAAFSAYLMWLQVAVLQAVCAWCAASAGLWGGLLGVSILLVRAPGQGPPAPRWQKSSADPMGSRGRGS